jgi:hypothetical protein
MCGVGDVGRTKALGRYGSVGRHVPGAFRSAKCPAIDSSYSDCDSYNV